jgi:hypothetical protein
VIDESHAKRFDAKYVLGRPARRPLKVYAQDPMAGRTVGNRMSIDVPNEELLPGPVSKRLEVIDYDSAHKCFYPPVNLDAMPILMQGGLEPAESDPRFHQQMVYAVAMRTLENFDRALGRFVTFNTKKYPRLRLFPHAFHGANAYYESSLNAILFGYFRSDRNAPGETLPGQIVFTCLSHDIIAHEMTHAIVDRLRRHFLDATNEDVLAFHEGFADIVALFQHFTFPELLRAAIQKTSGALDQPGPLVNLAQQFGHATGTGRALRSALGGAPNPQLYRTLIEPHDRGSILVAAVFDGFFSTYQRRIRDLVRISSGGTGLLPAGDLHPDLVNRIAGEATRTAQAILGICIRAFDYLPPVDITFGDYLRAMITADFELLPSDETGLRAAMIEAFRLRGIYPEGVASLAEESLLWPHAGQAVPPIPIQKSPALLEFVIQKATGYGRVGVWRGDSSDPADDDEDDAPNLSSAIAVALHAYAEENRVSLRLHPTLPIQVAGFHVVIRVAPLGNPLVELVAQFIQTDRSSRDRFGGVPLRGGSTVVAAANGEVRYVIAKPMPAAGQDADTAAQAAARETRQRAYLSASDGMDPWTPYGTRDEFAARAARRSSVRALHMV